MADWGTRVAQLVEHTAHVQRPRVRAQPVANLLHVLPPHCNL